MQINDLSIHFQVRATSLKVALLFAVWIPDVIAQEATDSDPAPWELVALVEDPEEKGGEFVRHPKDNIPLNTGKVATVGGKSRLEFQGQDGSILRVGHFSAFSPVGKNALEFRQGSFLLFLPDGADPISLVTPGVHVHLEAQGTYLGEIMPKGGLKLIPLEGSGQLKFEEASVSGKIRPGHVHFFLPEGKRPPGVEVYLPLLLASCPLLHSFGEDFPSMDKLIRRARIQAKMTKKRTGAFVYDAIDEEQIRFLVPNAPKEEEPTGKKKKWGWKLPKLNNPFK